MAYRIENASKGMWQRINEMLAAWVPRQAVVTRSESGGVWVRFAPVDPTSPESWFPSTLANVLAGTSGWVFTLGGKKGLFVATGVRGAVPISNSANQTVTATTTGDYPVTNAALTFSGLVPGTVVTVKAEVTFRVNATTGSASFGFQATSNGATALYSGGSIPATAGYTTFVYSAPRTIGADGIVSVVPALRWSSGTVTIAGAYITASVH